MPPEGTIGSWFRHKEHVEGRQLLTPFLLVQSGDREDSNGPAEIEPFNVLEEQEAR